MTIERNRALEAINIAYETMGDDDDSAIWSEQETVQIALTTAQVYATLDLAQAVRELKK